MTNDRMTKRGRARGAGKLGREFYARGAEVVARKLIGTVLVHRVGRKELRARVVETEAYVGPHDLACHAAKGRTKRTEVMFGEAGRAYVYFIYGMYDMLNVVTGTVGDAQAVLIRAAEALDGSEADLSGPGKLARGMKITRALNGCDLLGEELFFERGDGRAVRVVESVRIGVDYAKEWKDAMLRFYDAGSAAVSGRRGKIRVKGAKLIVSRSESGDAAHRKNS
jgi:DNA-3-methyladenine glycosylase